MLLDPYHHLVRPLHLEATVGHHLYCAMRWLKKVLTGGAKKEREREHRNKEQSAVAAPPIERRRWSFSKARKSIADTNRRPAATVVVTGELSQAKPCSCGA